MTRMRRLILLTLLFVAASLQQTKSEESALYLKNAIKDLQRLKDRHSLRRADTAGVQAVVSAPDPSAAPAAQRRLEAAKSSASPPPLSLTKGELAALYDAAVAKGETVKLNAGGKGYVHAAVHELDASPSYFHEQIKNQDDDDGYYYYYYPVKSFLDEGASSSSGHKHHYSDASGHPEIKPKDKPQYQYHSHTHQHNVKITSAKDHKEMETEKKKGLEPLFMAISGFVGMAVMFVLSVIVFPKFGIKRKTSFLGTVGGIKKNERITNIARVALEAIEGKDCAERFACEFEKTARTFNIQDNRFVKLLKRMAPVSIGKQMDRMGKLGKNRLRCTAIPCKKKNAANEKKGAVQKKS